MDVVKDGEHSLPATNFIECNYANIHIKELFYMMSEVASFKDGRY